MNCLDLKDVIEYVENNIGVFHEKRIAAVKTLKLNKVLSKKNPYLFKAKNILSASEIVKNLSDAYLSSQEESMFGNWLEGLAIFINESVLNGRKSGIPGIDLEFDSNDIRYIVSIKSGPNWGNSSQIKKMKAEMKAAKISLRTSNSKINVIAIVGCCYGRDNKPDKGDYFKYCGQVFWSFISGDSDLYTKIIEPLGHKAKEKNEVFFELYNNMLNKFTYEFMLEYCNADHSINWEKFVRFNSEMKKKRQKIK